MSNDAKKSTRDALERFYKRQADELSPDKQGTTTRRRNNAPEKEVQNECLAWMRSKGWSVQIFEAKATWNPRAQAWTQQSMSAGTCDCLGNTSDGISVAIEFKAKGKLSTFAQERNQRQQKFMQDKIATNSFACVVDSASILRHIWDTWLMLRAENVDRAREYLERMLPKPSLKTRLKSSTLFDE